jgi:hypothetical protein
MRDPRSVNEVSCRLDAVFVCCTQSLFRRWLRSRLLRRVVWYKFTDVSEVLAASIIEAMWSLTASTSETSVNFYQTTRHKQLEREPLSYSPPWGPEISGSLVCFKRCTPRKARTDSLIMKADWWRHTVYLNRPRWQTCFCVWKKLLEKNGCVMKIAPV